MNHLETCYFGEIGDLVIDVFVSLCFQHSYYDQTHRKDADQLCCSCRLCQWRQVCPSSSTVIKLFRLHFFKTSSPVFDKFLLF